LFAAMATSLSVAILPREGCKARGLAPIPRQGCKSLRRCEVTKLNRKKSIDI
jgi:hypothetical protein